jgi:hypothetical protein
MPLPLDPGQISSPYKSAGALPLPPIPQPTNGGPYMPGSSPYSSGGAIQVQAPTSNTPYSPPQGPMNGPANVFTGANSQQLLGGGTTSTGDDLYNNLLQQLSGMGGAPDISALTALANQEASLKYDPLISQLQGNLGTAKANEATASKNIGDLYGSLGKGLAAQIPGITQQFAAQQSQANNQYNTLQQQIQQNYQGAQNAQQAELEKLGIQAALPQSTQQLTRDQAYQGSQAANNGKAVGDAINQMGQGQQDFFQRAAAIAPMTGANTQSDLAQKLLQLQNQTGQQIAGYKGQQGAEAQMLLMQMEQQAAQQGQTQQSNLINQTKALAELQNLVHPGIFGSSSTATPKYSGIQGIQQYLGENSGTADPNQLYSDLAALENDKQFQQLTGPGGIGSPNLETAWPELQKLVQQIDPNTYNNNAAMTELFNALAIKYGKY